MIATHKMLMTDGDGQLAQTVRHSRVGGGDRRAVGLAGGCSAAVTDGCDGWFGGGLALYRPALKQAEIRG